jgi:AcrR family transcriptional regulator
VPNDWNESVQAHRREMRDAILDTTASLAAGRGLLGVTMSRIADEAGIGRATLYKYFPDLEEILVAWHERQIAGHLEQLATIRDQSAQSHQRLEAVLEAYALIFYENPTELPAVLHASEHLADVQRQIKGFIEELLTEGAQAGGLRDDIAPNDLATYCLHALTAASRLRSEAAVRQLVAVIVAGLRPAH